MQLTTTKISLASISIVRGQHINFSCNINTFQFYHPSHNTNTRLVIGFHISVECIGYVHLRLVVVGKRVSRFLWEGILSVIMLPDMYLTILNRFLDVFGRAHSSAPNAIMSRHLYQLDTHIDVGLTNRRGFKCKILINTRKNDRHCMMDYHNVIYIA